MGEGLERLAAEAPAGRPATADEIAEAIVFLATDRSSFVQGARTRSGWRQNRHLRRNSNRLLAMLTKTKIAAMHESAIGPKQTS